MSPIPSTGALLAAYRPPNYTHVATPVTKFGISYRPEKNGPGAGSVKINLHDPAAALIQVNDVIAIRRDGTTAAALLVEQIHQRTLDPQEKGAHTVTYSGRLAGGMLEWAMWAPVLGERAKPIEFDTVLDWRSNRYDMGDDPWENSSEIITVTAAKAGGWPTTPMGQSFTDSTGAYMIWHSSGNASDAPVGTCLFILDVNITSPGRHGLEVLMDNDGFVWVDTVQQLEISQTEGYHRASFKRIDLSEAVHRFAFQVRNIGPDETSGPAALAFNLFKTDHQDRPLPGVPVVAKSDSSVQVLEYPDPFPGMTVGDDLEHWLSENQALGALPQVNLSCTKLLDSDGEAWDRESITTKTGSTSGLQFLDELVAAKRISRWRFSEDGETLDVFKPGYSTRPGDVTLTPAPANDARTGQVVLLDRKIT